MKYRAITPMSSMSEVLPWKWKFTFAGLWVAAVVLISSSDGRSGSFLGSSGGGVMLILFLSINDEVINGMRHSGMMGTIYTIKLRCQLISAIQPTKSVAKITEKLLSELFIPSSRVRALPTKFCDMRLAAKGITRPQPTPSRQLSRMS